MENPGSAITNPGPALEINAETGPQNQAQRLALIDSLRRRYAKALADDDAEAKQALFREAVYLDIQPGLFTEPA
jgi:hypothetical protein